MLMSKMSSHQWMFHFSEHPRVRVQYGDAKISRNIDLFPLFSDVSEHITCRLLQGFHTMSGVETLSQKLLVNWRLVKHLVWKFWPNAVFPLVHNRQKEDQRDKLTIISDSIPISSKIGLRENGKYVSESYHDLSRENKLHKIKFCLHTFWWGI